MFSRSDILNDLKNLGIKRGDKLIVHSSFKAVGHVEGGPDTVIDALMETVGEQGNIMMPTFCDDPPELFELEKSPSDCGIITNLFRRRPGIIRSFHPSHSVAVWGNDAEQIAKTHESATALGVGSPMHELIKMGAYILLIGVDHNRNSAIHIAERILPIPHKDVPYNESFSKPIKVLRNGKIESMFVEECPGCSTNFLIVGDALNKKGRQITGKIGNAVTHKVKGSDLIECTLEILKEDAGALLCKRKECPYCPRAREVFTESLKNKGKSA
jgi:aminoglycoside 3-N-acetyltransferase